MKKIIIFLALLLNLLPYLNHKIEFIFTGELFAQETGWENEIIMCQCPCSRVTEHLYGKCPCGGKRCYECPCCHKDDGTCDSDWCNTWNVPSTCKAVKCLCCGGTTCSEEFCDIENKSTSTCSSTDCLCCEGKDCSSNWCNRYNQDASECAYGTLCRCCGSYTCKSPNACESCTVKDEDDPEIPCDCGHLGCPSSHIMSCGNTHCDGHCTCYPPPDPPIYCFCGHPNCTLSHMMPCGKTHCDDFCTCPICCCGIKNCPKYGPACGNCLCGDKHCTINNTIQCECCTDPHCNRIHCALDESICDASAYYYEGEYNCNNVEDNNPSDPESSNITDQGKNNMSEKAKEVFKSSNLHPTVQDSLNKMIEKIMEDCIHKAIINLIANDKDPESGKNLYDKANTIFIDQSLAGRGQAMYSRPHNNISIVSKYMITNLDVWNTAALEEEIYHLYQFQYYEKSTDITFTIFTNPTDKKLYRKSSWTESSGYIEFEPKLAQDISAIMRGEDTNSYYHDWAQLRNSDEKFKVTYYNWLKSLTQNGKVLPNEIDFAQYDFFAREWQKQSIYADAKFDKPINPTSLINAIKKSDCLK